MKLLFSEEKLRRCLCLIQPLDKQRVLVASLNATYFVTGVGGRRQTTVTLDGANNDEGWGRQTAIATVPIGAIQEMNVLSNAFSSEFGWTSGPALNIVTNRGLMISMAKDW